MNRCGVRSFAAAPLKTSRNFRIGSSTTIAAVVATMALLTACEEDQAPPVEYVRAIKTFTITDVASGQTRKFSGLVHATDSSTLSFQVAGNVRKMLVKQGDRVKKGKVLAILDKQPYRLDVKAAQADLKKARAVLAQSRQEFRRQQTLYKKGWVAKARLDRVRRSRDASLSGVEYATSKLNLARRDLRLTELKAPYDGRISRKHIEAFVEVKTGQPVYTVEASGAVEVRFDMPETTISRITLGMPVTVTFPTVAGSVLQARVTEIGSSAERANAFPIKAGLVDPPPEVRSGMTTEVTILLKQEREGSAYLVPIAAIAPGDNPGQGYVFVYDATTQTVKRNLIKGKGATDNFAHVFEGVKAGDVVAAAGVSFLNDGQKVKLMRQQATTGPGAPVTNR